MQALSKRVQEYNRLLAAYGLKDHQVRNVALGGYRAVVLLLIRLLRLFVIVLCIVPGLLINGPIALICKHIAMRKAKGESRLLCNRSQECIECQNQRE